MRSIEDIRQEAFQTAVHLSISAGNNLDLDKILADAERIFDWVQHGYTKPPEIRATDKAA